MIRTTLESETDTLLAIAQGTGVFKPLEIAALREVLDDYHSGLHHQGHRALTYEQDGWPIGFAYYAPTAMTENTWHLYWIFIDKTTQARGIGAKLHRGQASCPRRGRHRVFRRPRLSHRNLLAALL
jgi:hypothetical protein